MRTQYLVKVLIAVRLGAQSAYLWTTVTLMFPPFPGLTICAPEGFGTDEWDTKIEDVTYDVATGEITVSPTAKDCMTRADFNEEVASWYAAGFVE